MISFLSIKKSAPGKKVVFVVEPGLAKTENGKKLLDAQKKAFDKAYGGSCEVVELEVEGLNEEDGGSYADTMKIEDFERDIDHTWKYLRCISGICPFIAASTFLARASPAR